MVETHESLVSIVLPTYNRALLINRAVESVLNQTHKNWELLIVDDCSTDDTAEVVEKYYASNEKIRYVKLEKNQGACVARNEGLKLSRGEYITFLDSDDEYFPDKVELQVQLFKTSKVGNLGVVTCGREDARNGKVYSTRMPRYKGDVLKPLLSKKYMGANTPFLMITRAVVEKGILFDPKMPAGQDFDFLVRVCKHFNYDYVDKILVRVNHHSGQRVYTNDSAIRAFNAQYEKYGELMRQYPAVHKNFTIKQADLLFVYGRDEEAKEVLSRLSGSLDKTLWLTYFNVFGSAKSIFSRGALKTLRYIYFR